MSSRRNWFVTLGALPILILFTYISVGVLVISDGPLLLKLMIAVLAAGVAFIAARVALVGTVAEMKRWFNWLF